MPWRLINTPAVWLVVQSFAINKAAKVCISNKYHQPCFEQGMCVDLNLQGMPAKQVLRQQQYPQQVFGKIRQLL